jgi:hypothetical protein
MVEHLNSKHEALSLHLSTGEEINKKQINIWRWVWWCSPIILAFQRLSQEDCEFDARLGYVVSSRPDLYTQ